MMTVEAAAPQEQAQTQTRVIGPSSRRVWLLGAGAALVAGSLITLWNPSDDGVVLCPFHAATGLDCPACGSLRAVAALGRGRPIDAADHNLLLLVLPVFVALGFAARRWGASSRAIAVVATVIVVVFWIVRNLPGVPFLGAGIG